MGLMKKIVVSSTFILHFQDKVLFKYYFNRNFANRNFEIIIYFFTATLNVECSDGTFHCKNSTKCIDVTNICNGKKDCPNGDDESSDCGKF